MNQVSPVPRLRASALCMEHGRLLVVRLQDPESKAIYLFPPGGAIETGESPAHAATRETREETGYSVAVDGASEQILDYPFRWAGVDYACRTHFFLARLVKEQPANVADPEHILGSLWLPLLEVSKAFSFHTKLQAFLLRTIRP